MFKRILARQARCFHQNLIDRTILTEERTSKKRAHCPPSKFAFPDDGNWLSVRLRLS
jgi:hypothetical protein